MVILIVDGDKFNVFNDEKEAKQIAGKSGPLIFLKKLMNIVLLMKNKLLMQVV